MVWKARLLVVAIDFGTTYSGYAYSFRSDYKSSPTKVSTLNFKVGSTQMPKMPTSVLFTPGKEFHSFGAEAEEEYARLCVKARVEAERWYFFQRFKLALLNEESLDRSMPLADETWKKEMTALDVFSAAIAYMKKHFTGELQRQETSVRDDDITWVLTVPAIWEEKAKSFMFEAAEKAGIPGDQLMLALEPEAASVFCLEHYRSVQTLSRPFDVSKPGTKFVVADCGGGTIDISAFQVQEENTLGHLHRPEGTCEGGTKVDAAFDKFLCELQRRKGINDMEMLLLMREFESVKRSPVAGEKVCIKMPETIKVTMQNAIRNAENKRNTESHKYHGKVTTVRSMLMLDYDLFASFFENPATSIPASIKDVLASGKVGSVGAIILAGGFSESKIIQDAVTKALPGKKVLVAPSPSAAVLIGAVMLGHNPDVIATRISAYTYGVDTRLLFKEGVHDEARRVIGEDGVKRCEDCFHVHISIDEEVKVNTLLPYQTYYPTKSDQTAVTFGIYRSTKKKPLYVDEEGSEKIGTVTIPMPDTTGGRSRKVKAAMMVGGTKLTFMALDEKTGKEVSTKCDFLSKN